MRGWGIEDSRQSNVSAYSRAKEERVVTCHVMMHMMLGDRVELGQLPAGDVSRLCIGALINVAVSNLYVMYR